MALIRADRVKESSTSTSTSAFLLNGADSTYRTFASACAVGDTVYYAIAHRSANEWEVGLGTYSAVNTLTRTTVHASSNANAAVAFSTGAKDVLLALTKAQLETYATLAGTETLTNKTISGANNTITNVSLTTGATGTLPLANGGTGTTTAQLAINALAGAVTSGSYLRGNGTNVVMSTIQAADVPTLNQNTTGTASGSVSGTASYVPKFTSANVVGNSQIYDDGTNIGIGAVPVSGYTGYRLQVGSSGDSQTYIAIGNSTTGLGPLNGIIVGCDASSAYLLNRENTGLRLGTNNYDRILIGSDGLVSISAAPLVPTPGAQLQVTTAAAATKGLIVKGASGQSANLQEWQDNSGTVLASINSSGSAVFGAQTGAQTSSVVRAWCTPSNTLNGQILTSLTGATGANERYRMSIGNTSSYGFLQTYENAIGYTMSLALQPSGGSVSIGTTSTSDTLHIYNATYPYLRFTNSASTHGLRIGVESGSFALVGVYQGNMPLTFSTSGSASGGYNERMRIGSNGLIGVNESSPGAQLHVTSSAAATKGLIVRGASGQSANLQEWQNNAGTRLAHVDSNGNFRANYGYYLTSDFAGFVINGSRIGVGTSTATVFGCEYGNYMRPNIVSLFPDGAGYIGTIINTSNTYANATAKLLSVQNNGTEKFAVFSDGSMAGVDARLTGSIQITSNTPAAFTADQNNLVLNASGFQRLSGTAARNITGIAPPSGASHVDGRMIRILNVGTNTLTFKHNSASSSAANRFFSAGGSDIALSANGWVECIYDATDNGSGAAGWRIKS